MSQTPLILCAPSFLDSLRTAFPEALITPFSDKVEDSLFQITALDNQDQRQGLLLFKSSGDVHHNEPVKDHINLSAQNTLIGPADLSKGPRFPDMSSVYEHDGKGLLVVLGQDPDLSNFDEPWVPVLSGIWEAIALKHRGYKINGWVIADLDKWIREKKNLEIGN